MWGGAAVIAAGGTAMLFTLLLRWLDLKGWRDANTRGIAALLGAIWVLGTIVVKLTYHP